MRQNVLAADLVVEGVEAVAGFCLRFRVQRRLQFLNAVAELIGRPISRSLTASCVCLELRPLPSPGVTRLHRYYEPLRHPTAPSLSLAGVWLIIPDHALGLPVLRALSLCTCCRHYPGAAAGRRPRSSHPAVTAFPDNVVGSAMQIPQQHRRARPPAYQAPCPAWARLRQFPYRAANFGGFRNDGDDEEGTASTD